MDSRGGARTTVERFMIIFLLACCTVERSNFRVTGKGSTVYADSHGHALHNHGNT